MAPASERRRKGEVPELVLYYLSTRAQGERLTPYRIAKALNLSAGSVTAACKALVRDGAVTLYGESPYMVGRKA